MAGDLIKDAKAAFADAEDAEHDNRQEAAADIDFARLGKQWPDDVLKQRQGRPSLTINKMPAFIRQVVNDARQNKPSIKVHPVDSGADKETADIINGLIRNIEYTSSADVAYDTATEHAVGNGFGYFRIGLDYAHEDTFDFDISIDRVSNPFSVYGDPRSTAADSSDWNSAFVVEMMAKKEFEQKYKGAEPVDWGSDDYKVDDPWFTEDSVMVAEWWRREQYDKPIVLLSDGTVQSVEAMKELGPILAAQGITVVNERVAKCYRVKQHILNGHEELDSTDWPGQYIPIIPVYGDEVDVKGKRYFRSLIRDAKDAQRMFNYWRTTSTELIALAPKTPFIGKKGSFKTDAAKWATSNVDNHAYMEYDGDIKPERQPFASIPAGALQEALNASDDMKAIMGLFDASLGARSNETSGKAIMARQREGDVSTFHFQDNMVRAIRHAGRCLIDLIPKVYDKPRIVRVIGEDGTQEAKQVNAPTTVMNKQGQPVMDDKTGQAITRIYDLTAGKYDLTVTAGPSFTTRREEAAAQMTEMVRAFPDAAPVIGDLIAKNLDWPGADEIAERLKSINPALQGQQPNPMQEMAQQASVIATGLELQNKKLQNDKLEADIGNVVNGSNTEPPVDPQEVIRFQQEMAQNQQRQQQEEQDRAAKKEREDFDFMHRQRMAELEHKSARADLTTQLKGGEMSEADTELAAEDGIIPAERRHQETLQGFQMIAEGFQRGMEAMAQAIAAPKKIDVIKDAQGRIVGGASRPTLQ